MSVKLCLVRHGRTSFTERGLLCGWSDPSLDDEGVAQARTLADMLGGRAFDGVWSSDLRRAVETARIATGIEPVLDPRIRELDLGDLEGKRFDQCSPDVQAGLIAFDSFVAPGGESVGAFRTRVRTFLADLPAGDHLVVTHGGVMRLLLRDTGSDRPVAPCEIVELDLPPGKTSPASEVHTHRRSRPGGRGEGHLAEESPDSTGQDAGESARRGDPRKVQQRADRL